jgi:hypothetical protein
MWNERNVYGNMVGGRSYLEDHGGDESITLR